MNSSPIPIIGASAAGLAAAGYLARRGVPVRVYEAQAPFRPAERTLIVTPALLRLLDFDPRDAVRHHIRAFELISRQASARIPLREPDIMLDRARFLHLLARRVEEAGGEIFPGHRLTEIQAGSSPYILRFATGENRQRWVPAPRILGADGLFGQTARALPTDGLERVALCQARVPLPGDLPPDTVRVWFDRATTRFFYWLIPDSPCTGVAGLVAETPESARQLLEGFLRAHGLEPLGWQEGQAPLFPLSFSGAPLGDLRILLAGDAAGQVKGTTVGGLVAGIRGGLAAARALAAGTFYDAEARALQRELAFHALVRRVLDAFTDEDYDALLRLLNGRARSVLGRYHRDELARGVWWILLSQPRWLLLGVRALLRGLRSGGRSPEASRRGAVA